MAYLGDDTLGKFRPGRFVRKAAAFTPMGMAAKAARRKWGRKFGVQLEEDLSDDTLGKFRPGRFVRRVARYTPVGIAARGIRSLTRRRAAGKPSAAMMAKKKKMAGGFGISEELGVELGDFGAAPAGPARPAQAAVVYKPKPAPVKAPPSVAMAKTAAVARRIPSAYWEAVRYRIAQAMSVPKSKVVSDYMAAGLTEEQYMGKLKLKLPKKWGKVAKRIGKVLKKAAPFLAVAAAGLAIVAIPGVAPAIGGAAKKLWGKIGSLRKSAKAAGVENAEQLPDTPLDPGMASMDAKKIMQANPGITPEQAMEAAAQAQAVKISTGQLDPQQVFNNAAPNLDPAGVNRVAAQATAATQGLENVPAVPTPEPTGVIPDRTVEAAAAIPKSIAQAGMSWVPAALIGMVAAGAVLAATRKGKR